MEKVTYTILVILATTGAWQLGERFKLIPPQVTMEAQWLGEEAEQPQKGRVR